MTKRLPHLDVELERLQMTTTPRLRTREMANDISPLFPASKETQEIANQVKFTLEQSVSEMFPMYKALTYRVSPFVLPPSLDSCYHIKVETVAEKQCYHIVVHVVTEGGRTTFTLVAYQPEVELHAPLDKIHVLGGSGQML